MNSCELGLLLEALGSPDSSQEAWAQFLDSYSSVLYQSARNHTSNHDAAADCYLYICERLSSNGFRRLLKFRPEGKASLTTWLRVVSRNLCFDWHRSQSGRQRPFKSVQHLSPLELEIYNSRFVYGRSQQETLNRVESLFQGIAFAELSEIEERLQHALSSRQHWILSTRWRSESVEVPVGEDGESREGEIADPHPSQEKLLSDRQVHEQLEKRVAALPARERLIVQLRFEQELSLEEIARVCGLRDAQNVHRALTAILRKLREAMQQSSGKIRNPVRERKVEERRAGYPLPQSDESQ